MPARREELLALDRIGEKTLDNLFARIEASKRRPLRQLLVGLSIRHVGGETARDLALHFGEMAALQVATVEEIEAIDGIGPVVARALREYLDDADNAREIERLRAAGVRMDDELTARGGPLDGEVVVVTGALDRWSRNEVERLVKGARRAGERGRDEADELRGGGHGRRARSARRRRSWAPSC